MEEMDLSGLVNEYLDDARSHLDKLDICLMEMEKDLDRGEVDVEVLSDLLGDLHTLKGNSGMMGFESLQQYIHSLEGLFKALLEGKAALTEGLVQKFFDSAAVLRGALDQLKSNPKCDLLLEEQAKALTEPLKSEGHQQEIPGAGVRQQVPRQDSFRYIAEKSNILKVDFERLDHLLNLAGELVIYRTKLALVDKMFRELYPDKDLAYELGDVTASIYKSTSQLQEAIMKVRMLPIRQVFHRFPRMVRDLSRERGKEINLSFKGESTELDKTVIDEIGEPLIHLIRNAIDHGIEAPRERLGRRKSSTGEITLAAMQEGNHIIITVSDDGAGIDIEGVREKAAKVFGKDFIEGMGREELLELIFEPGFSTASEVTEVSGRGVGLDVVKKNVSRLGGDVEVKSEVGKGCVFIIKLPLTLAIISALMVRSKDVLYAVPLSSVVEIMQLMPEEIRTISGCEVIILRDQVLPLIRLEKTFDENSGAALNCQGGERQYAVVVGQGNKIVAFLVDGLMGRQEIVIKSLDDYLGDSENIAGATILGDGRVVLILDVSGIIEKNLAKQKRVNIKEVA